MVSELVVSVVEQQVQVELRPVTAAVALHPVLLVRVDLLQVTAAVALHPVLLVRADLRQDMAAVALQPVLLARADLRRVMAVVAPQPVPLVRVDLRRVMAVVALQPVPLVRADLRRVMAVAVQVARRQVLPVRVDLRQGTAVVPRQELLLRVASRGRNFYLLLKSAVSEESAESAAWGQQADQGPVRWGCEAERPELLDQGLAEPAGPDCSSVGPAHRVE